MSYDHLKFEQYWCETAGRLNLSNVQRQQILELLKHYYSEPHRAYHTTQHIVECIELFHLIQSSLQDPVAIELAIWFHDVIYEPKSTQNELDSAELFLQLMQDILSSVQCMKIYHWILATQKHLPTADTDLQYLLDIDLAILGQSPARFSQYDHQIRQEYAWVHQHTYQQKRAEVLKGMMAHGVIYQTAFFQQHFQTQAEQNLKQALATYTA